MWVNLTVVEAVITLALMNHLRPKHWIAGACFGVPLWTVFGIGSSLFAEERHHEAVGVLAWVLWAFALAIPAIDAWAGWRLIKRPNPDHFKLAVFLLVAAGVFTVLPRITSAGWIEVGGVSESGANLVGFVLANRVWAWICAWGMRSEAIEVGRFEFVRRTFLVFVAVLLALFLSEVGVWLETDWAEPPREPLNADWMPSSLWPMVMGLGPLLAAVLFYKAASGWLIKHGAGWDRMEGLKSPAGRD